MEKTIGAKWFHVLSRSMRSVALVYLLFWCKTKSICSHNHKLNRKGSSPLSALWILNLFAEAKSKIWRGSLELNFIVHASRKMFWLMRVGGLTQDSSYFVIIICSKSSPTLLSCSFLEALLFMWIMVSFSWFWTSVSLKSLCQISTSRGRPRAQTQMKRSNPKSLLLTLLFQSSEQMARNLALFYEILSKFDSGSIWHLEQNHGRLPISAKSRVKQSLWNLIELNLNHLSKRLKDVPLVTTVTCNHFSIVVRLLADTIQSVALTPTGACSLLRTWTARCIWNFTFGDRNSVSTSLAFCLQKKMKLE